MPRRRLWQSHRPLLATAGLGIPAPPEESGLDLTGRRRLCDAVKAGLEQVFKQASAGMANNADLWGVWAEYHRILGESLAEKECLLKRVRGLQGGQWQKDEARFAAFAAASVDLCSCYLRLWREDSGRRSELAAARMHLKSVTKQAQERFESTKEFAALKTLLDQVIAAEEQTA